MKIRKYIGPQRMFMWHCIQAISVVMLLVTGFGMYFADLDVLKLGFETHHSLHEIVGIVACAAYVLFFCTYHIEANRHRLAYRWRILLYKIAVTKEKAKWHERMKHVVLSRYIIVMFLVFPVMMVTGCLMLFPRYSMKIVWGLDVYNCLLVAHVACSIIMLVFLAAHFFIVLVNKKKARWLHPFLKVWYKF